MAKLCCIPTCNNRAPAVSLFHVLSKHKAKNFQLKWAEEMEKIILGCRSDKYILDLYRRDCVRICSVHFQESDIMLSKSIYYKISKSLPQQLVMKTCGSLSEGWRFNPGLGNTKNF